MSSSSDNSPSNPTRKHLGRSDSSPDAAEQQSLADELADVEASLTLPSRDRSAHADQPGSPQPGAVPLPIATPPLTMVEVAFLASTASLLWLVSYYLSIGPWMRILFPIPIALVYLRWGHRAAWMSAITSGLLLSVLMGPYLSLLFCIPYALLGVQLGFMWRRRSRWLPSIAAGTLISTLGFFFRLGLLSIFLGEDLWAYLTNRITDFIQWILTKLIDWGWLGLEALGQTDLTVVQLVTVLIILCSDFVYIFTVHLAAWLLLERLGNPIPAPPNWVQVLLEEE